MRSISWIQHLRGRHSHPFGHVCPTWAVGVEGRIGQGAPRMNRPRPRSKSMTEALTEKAVVIPVMRATTLHRTKTPLVIGIISADDLAQLYEVPRRDTRTKTGYQREVATARV